MEIPSIQEIRDCFDASVSPKIFYELRHYYTTMNIIRIRRFTGDPVPAAFVDPSKDKRDTHERRY